MLFFFIIVKTIAPIKHTKKLLLLCLFHSCGKAFPRGFFLTEFFHFIFTTRCKNAFELKNKYKCDIVKFKQDDNYP